MRLPRVRFTVGRLMAAVAVLAVVLGATVWVARMRARSAAFRQRAWELSYSTMRMTNRVKTDDGRWVDLSEDENIRGWGTAPTARSRGW